MHRNSWAAWLWPVRFAILVLALIIPTLALAASPNAPARRAFIIGIDGYAAPELQVIGGRTGEDAIQVASVLNTVAGYDTVVTAPRDADKAAFVRSFSGFLKQVQPGDQVFVFYSGHGVENDGDNYFLLTDAPGRLAADDVERGGELDRTAVSLRGLMAQIRKLKPGNVVVVINACRNDVGPEATLGTDADFSAPSTNVPAPAGSMVIYATSSGSPARVCLDRDCSTDSSPMTVFTRRFVDVLRTPNLAAADLIDEVGSAVEADVNQSVQQEQLVSVNDQIPFRLKKRLFLGPISAVASVDPAVVVDPLVITPDASADALGRCADLAAIPETTTLSAGVRFGEIRPNLAIEACSVAARLLPASPEAATWLGRAFDADGQFEKAVTHYEVAANLSYAPAQNSLGLMFANGDGVTKDYSRAMALFTLASDQGYAAAQNNLGDSYYNGLGTQKDFAKSARLYKLAADQGSAYGQKALGIQYEDGEGVPQSYAEAFRLYSLAANQGFAIAQNNLGVLYDHGRGVGENEFEAARLYGLAAAQMDATAQFNLAGMYKNGRGVKKSLSEAKRYYKLAADAGFEPAAAALKQMTKK